MNVLVRIATTTAPRAGAMKQWLDIMAANFRLAVVLQSLAYIQRSERRKTMAQDDPTLVGMQMAMCCKRDG